MPLFEERRYVTLMDIDLVGSTAMDVALGQESAADVKLAFRHIAKEEIEANFGAYRSTGDGIFAEFGLTHSIERTALAAVRAAAGIIRRIESDEEIVALLEARPQTRIGIHSGLTLIRTDERGAPDFFGTTPDLAARLQAAAGTNEVWLSEDAFASVRDFVRARKTMPVPLRGLRDPIVVYIVETAGQAMRAEPAASGDAPAFLGRERELAELLSAAEHADRRNVLQVIGPAGAGKTRLLREFRSQLRERGAPVISVTCDAFSQGVSLGAISAALAPFPGFGLAPSATIDEALETTAALVRHLRPAAGPVILIVDDAHLADRSSLSFFQRLAGAAIPRLLIVFGSRDGLADIPLDAAPSRDIPAPVVLGPLGSEDASAIVRGVAGAEALTPAQQDEIVARAAGVPLFLLELAAAAALPSTPDWREPSAIPASLWPGIQARLAPGRAHSDALRALSLFEGPLPAPVALAVMGAEDSAILGTFESSGLVRLTESATGRHCAFPHELLRRAVYESISPRAQPALHRSAAAALIERCPGYVAGFPHVVARQFALARESLSAARYYGLAGDLAVGQGAYLVAEDHYAAAFGLAESAPELHLRAGQLLVRVQMVNHGFGHAETVGATLARIGSLQWPTSSVTTAQSGARNSSQRA